MANLDPYRHKRNFTRTTEPDVRARAPRPRRSARPIYIIHKHDARRLHFDLRLEQDGVLRSWAVPKGPTLEVGEKHLAVAVEDHPFAYKDFEGTIPQGEYGGGTVMLWDRGHWRETKRHKDGHLDFELHGEKLDGAWTLTRMGGEAGEGGKNWLLIRRRRGRTSSAEKVALGDDAVSVATGRTMDEIARGAPSRLDAAKAERSAQLAALAGAREQALPRQQAPRLATAARQAPAGDDWLHEIKFDGYRLLAFLEAGTVRLVTRNGKDWSGRFPVLCDRLATLAADAALIDGELVALDRGGISRFEALQEAIAAERTDALVYQAFDLLYLDGFDLRKAPLSARKERLKALLGENPPANVRYTDHIVGQGPAFFETACRSGLEGIVSKRADSTYSAGRSPQWLKTKCVQDAEFIIGGYTEPRGHRGGFGALLLGAYDDEDTLVYTGRVGTGFSARQLERLHKTLQKIETDERPFRDAVPDADGVHWVRPVLVADVAYTERTDAGVLRHPSFRGLREDRNSNEVRLASNQAPQAPAQKLRRPSRRSRAERIAGILLTNPDRVLWPEAGITKRDLARYYETVGDRMLPQLRDRPLSLVRCPAGHDSECFFQKHPGDAVVPSVPRVDIEEKNGGTDTYVYVHTVADIVALAQAGTLEIHPWGSTIDAIEKPDLLVFDLDPAPDVAWPEVLRVGQALCERLDELGLVAFARLTGGKGLHLVVPLKRRGNWDEIKAFARAVCEAQVRDDPKRLTSNMSKARRHGRIFLDYLRNGRGATAIASYSTRARPYAPVAVPVAWSELDASLKPDHFHLGDVPQRLRTLKRDPWDAFEASRRGITRAMQRAVGMPG